MLFEQRFYHDIKIILKSWSGQVRWLIGEVKINFTSQIVRGVENTGMPTLGYFALLAFSSISSMFSKGFFFRVFKSQDCVIELNKGAPLGTVFYHGFTTKHFNPFPNKPWFLRVCSISLLKTLWAKEKLLVTSNFSISPQCFLPVSKTFCHFHQIWNCRLWTLYVWKSLKFVVWERVEQNILPAILYFSKLLSFWT